MRETGYEAWVRRERRRAAILRIAGALAMGAGAFLLAAAMYLALVGFLVVFG